MPVISQFGLIGEASVPQAILKNDIVPNEAFALYGNAAILGIEFPSYADGRGSSIAIRLRRMGYAGKLRAIGPLIPDQFAGLLNCGFDEVEISEAQLLRQPIHQWKAALEAQKFSYQQNSKLNISIPNQRTGNSNAD